MKTLLCFVTAALLVYTGSAQTAINIFTSAKGQAEYASPSALGYKFDADSVDYGDIKGSPFWKNDSGPAIVFLQDGRPVKVDKVRLNFYTNDVHYKFANGPELVAKTGTVKQIAFLKSSDSVTAVAYFQSFRDIRSAYNPNEAPFCQVLNEGQVQLLKLVSVNLDKKFDFVAGKMQSLFFSQVEYYLLKNNMVFEVKKISKENILAFVIPDADTDKWLVAHKNKLKSENEVIAFLDYYNRAN
jgi:hypothetical protein